MSNSVRLIPHRFSAHRWSLTCWRVNQKLSWACGGGVKWTSASNLNKSDSNLWKGSMDQGFKWNPWLSVSALSFSGVAGSRACPRNTGVWLEYTLDQISVHLHTHTHTFIVGLGWVGLGFGKWNMKQHSYTVHQPSMSSDMTHRSTPPDIINILHQFNTLHIRQHMAKCDFCHLWRCRLHLDEGSCILSFTSTISVKPTTMDWGYFLFPFYYTTKISESVSPTNFISHIDRILVDFRQEPYQRWNFVQLFLVTKALKSAANDMIVPHSTLQDITSISYLLIISIVF